MLSRVFVLLFLAAVFAGPFAGMIMLMDTTEAFTLETGKRGLCWTAGVGCGNGNVIVTIASRL